MRMMPGSSRLLLAVTFISLSVSAIFAAQETASQTHAASVAISPTPIPSRSLYGRLATGNSGDPSVPANRSTQSSEQWMFQEVFSYDLREYRCGKRHVVVADFDRDGLMDIILLATTGSESKAILLHNEGNWQFDDSILVQYDDIGYWAQAGDLNNDEWTDLVLRASRATHVFLNNRSGGFSEVWTGEPGFYSLDLADVNSDTFADILSGTQTGSGGMVEIFQNNGSGTSFEKTWESARYGSTPAANIYDVFSTKLNDDNFPDIAAIEIYDGLLLTFSGDGTGTSFTEETVLNLVERTFSLATGNVNDDNLTDLAAHVGWGQVRVFLSQDDGSVSEYWHSPDLGEAAFNLALEDFDQDGYDDLFVGTFGDGALRVYRNRPGTDFGLAWSDNLAGQGYTGAVADLDGDTYPDLIVGERDANDQNTIRILRFTVETSEPVTPTATLTATSTPTATPTALPLAGSDSLTARVFIDYRCDSFFQSGLDIPLGDVSVTLGFPNGASMTNQTRPFGWVNFSSFDAADGVTVSIALPRGYRGYSLASCPNSPASIDLELNDFQFGHAFVQFGAEVLGMSTGPYPPPRRTTEPFDKPPSTSSGRGLVEISRGLRASQHRTTAGLGPGYKLHSDDCSSKAGEFSATASQ